MYKKYPWWKYYFFHPIEFLICMIGLLIAIIFNWFEENEELIEEIKERFKW